MCLRLGEEDGVEFERKVRLMVWCLLYIIVSIAGIGLGLICFAGMAFGLLGAAGGLAVGYVAVGGIAVGVYAIGGLMVGTHTIYNSPELREFLHSIFR